MNINSRSKGKSGELECAKILSDELGVPVRRNLEQTALGGYDLLGIDGYAIEVKRAKAYSNQWFEQALRQAIGRVPVLLYRLDRQSWKCEMRGGDLIKELESEDEQVTLSIHAFCTIVRERIDGRQL